MLYINGERLNTSNRKADYEFAPYVADYHKALKEAKEHFGNPLILRTSVRPKRDKKTRVMRFPGARGLLLVSNVNYRFGDEISTMELRYSPTILAEEDGRLRHEDPNLLVKKAAYSVDIERNPDLAYYILRSGKVGRTPAEGKKFHLYDAKHIDEVNAEQRRLQGQILNLIYSAIPEHNLRILAKSFGVSDVSLRSLDSVREALYAKLQEAEKMRARKPGSDIRGYAAFISSSEVKEYDKISALCHDAEKAEKLKFNKDERRWEIDYKDGRPAYILKELSGDEFGNPLDALVGFLITEKNYLRKLETVMGVASSPKKERVLPPREIEKNITPEMVLTEHNVPRLKKLLKEIDPDAEFARNASGQHIKEMILARIVPESVQETNE